MTLDGRKVSDVLRDLTNSYRHKTLHELVVKSLQALGLMAVLSVGFGWGIAGRALGGLHRMTATARRLSEENLHERIALEGPDDELKELADTFDALLGRLEAPSRARSASSPTPPTSCGPRCRSSAPRSTSPWPTPTPRRRSCARMGEVVRRATERSDALIDGLLVLARSDRGPAERTPVDLAGLAEDALAQSAGEAAAAGVDTTGTFDPPRRPATPPCSAAWPAT